MKALVTGGAGFIGSHLVDRLLKIGFEVTVLDSLSQGNKLSQNALNSIELIQGDVNDGDLVLNCSKGAKFIFHLASVLGVDVVANNPILTMETEVTSAFNICRAAIYNGVEKVIYTSTSGVYGKAGIETAVDEDFLTSPSSSYAIGKRFNEIYFASVYEQRGLQSVSLRYFNVYGPRQDSRMVVPRFMDQARKNEPLTVFGNGSQTRDFTYIDDTIEATILSATNVDGCEILNVAGGTEFSISGLAEEVIEVCGSSSEVIFAEAPWRNEFEVARRIGDSTKLENLTGFRPATPRKKGLQLVFKYLEEQRSVEP